MKKQGRRAWVRHLGLSSRRPNPAREESIAALDRWCRAEDYPRGPSKVLDDINALLGLLPPEREPSFELLRKDGMVVGVMRTNRRGLLDHVFVSRDHYLELITMLAPGESRPSLFGVPVTVTLALPVPYAPGYSIDTSTMLEGA